MKSVTYASNYMMKSSKKFRFFTSFNCNQIWWSHFHSAFTIMHLMLATLNKACLKIHNKAIQRWGDPSTKQTSIKDKDLKTIILLNQDTFGWNEMYRQTLYSVSNITSKLPEKMGTSAPVEVGTRGTVGSLLKKEIEYFRRLEVDCCGSSVQSQRHVQDFASSGSNSWPSLRFLTMTWKRKKRRSSCGTAVRPGMCSMVEVADSHRLSEIPRFSYRNLRADMKEFEE